MARGYQGDAELLDIIYSRDYRGCVTAPVTLLGAAIFDYTIRCHAPSAVLNAGLMRCRISVTRQRQVATLRRCRILSHSLPAASRLQAWSPAGPPIAAGQRRYR